jgi:tetratricopeptide (TPR) repeat protein
MTLAAAALALRLRPRVSRVAWLVLLAAAIANALILNLHPVNLIHGNLVHYFLGAKYPIPYKNFYKAVHAALEKPQIGMRDLDDPDRFVRPEQNDQRAYYIDLMREAGVDFDPLVSLGALQDRARSAGVLQRESQRILRENLPAARIEDFRRDVRVADSGVIGHEISVDAGFNGSPFYTFVRHADPTLYRPLGRSTAWFNLALQVVGVFLLVWMMGKTFDLDINGRLAMAVLVFASWDFVGFAFPGLIFTGLWIPVAVSLYAVSRRAMAPAGAAIAWASLIKLFPFILLLPAAARLVRRGLYRRREGNPGGRTRLWFQLIVWCGAATCVLGLASILGGRSWYDFLDKIVIQFTSQGVAGNNVSFTKALSAIGISGSPLAAVFSVVSLITLTAMFLRGSDDECLRALPRRSLILIAAMGWVTHKWLNYYSIAALLLLPLLARRHRFGAPGAAVAMAFSFILPDFDDPLLRTHSILGILKVAPYVFVPALLVFLEFRSVGLSRWIRRTAVVACASLLLVTAGEAWRMHTIKTLKSSAYECLKRGETGRALEQYRRLVRLSPRDEVGYMGRSAAHAILGDVTSAINDFERSIRLDPENVHAHLNYARFLLKKGRIEEAARELEEARRLAPYDETVLFHLARARLEQENSAEAASLLVRARELNPGNEAIRGLLEQVAPSSSH